MKLAPVVLLPTTVKPVRDPLYTSIEEAQIVASNLQYPLGPVTDPNLEIVEVTVEEVGGEANIYLDGRLALEIRFSKELQVLNSNGRQQLVSVPFRINAGENLENATLRAMAPWKLLAEPAEGGPDKWEGDVEK